MAICDLRLLASVNTSLTTVLWLRAYSFLMSCSLLFGLNDCAVWLYLVFLCFGLSLSGQFPLGFRSCWLVLPGCSDSVLMTSFGFYCSHQALYKMKYWNMRLFVFINILLSVFSVCIGVRFGNYSAFENDFCASY